MKSPKSTAGLLIVPYCSLWLSSSSSILPSALAFAPAGRRRVAQIHSTIHASTAKVDLPDYGKTPVEVDQIQVARKKWQRTDLFGESIIQQTLDELEADEATTTAPIPTKEERQLRRRALDQLGIPEFRNFVDEKFADDDASSQLFVRKEPAILQLNVGLYCNQACGHCHVESSPLRKEMMTAETAAQCLTLLKSTPSIQTLDLTGGAPEMNQSFRTLVALARQLRPDLEIIDRCNLTVLQEPGQEDLIDFLKEHKVRVIASLPCYSEANVDQQRGRGVFERSIAALIALNQAGYAANRDDKDTDADGLYLDLVYNPLGAFLPPEQSKLEGQYREQLRAQFGIEFNQLFTITNMPIKRFADYLHQRGELQEYMDLLVRNFNPQTTENLMCLDMISVGWDGRIFDCDFNQQLDMTIRKDKKGLSIFDIDSLKLQDVPIRTDNHCFGCTAGMGSS